MFSKKATKIYLTLTTECQIDGGEFVKSSFFKNVDGIVKIRKEVVKIWNFLPICLESYVSEKNQANVSKKFRLTTLASQSVLFGQANKNSNFHNFLSDFHTNPNKLLNQRCLYPIMFDFFGLLSTPFFKRIYRWPSAELSLAELMLRKHHWEWKWSSIRR